MHLITITLPNMLARRFLGDELQQLLSLPRYSTQYEHRTSIPYPVCLAILTCAIT